MAAQFNLLALDVGERRIGLAIANSLSRLSSPFKTIIYGDDTLLEIGEIISSESINVLVVGLPRSLDGEDTTQTKFVREFSDKLKDSVEIPVYFEDEALSSVRAKKTLDEGKKAYQKEDIDALAASYILDDFMTNNKEIFYAKA